MPQDESPTPSDSATPKRTSSPTEQGSKKKGKRKRTPRPYPASSFEQAFELAVQIQRVAAGERVRRLTLLKEMNKSPSSSGSKQLITNSSK